MVVYRAYIEPLVVSRGSSVKAGYFVCNVRIPLIAIALPLPVTRCPTLEVAYKADMFTGIPAAPVALRFRNPELIRSQYR